MSFGLDYINTSPNAAKALGATFVCRYVGTGVGKVLTPVEASALMSLGIDIVSNFEWYASRPQEGFASGVADAHTANSIHLSCGGPSAAPIYFSVDYQSNGIDAADYFRGVISVLGVGRTGVYGGYNAVKYLADNGLVSWIWQTYAWSGSTWDPRAHIRQYSNGHTASDGTQVDFDQSMMSNFGSWKTFGGLKDMVTNLNGLPNFFTSGTSGTVFNIQNAFYAVSDAAYTTLNNIPGFAGIVIALDEIEQFQPYALPDNSGIIGQIPGIGQIVKTLTLPADSIQAILMFTVSNIAATLVRALIMYVGIVIVITLIRNALSAGVQETTGQTPGQLAASAVKLAAVM